MKDVTEARGYRNNNPGNIDAGAPWQGLMPRDRMTPAQKREKRFAVFSEPKWGIRAIARVLITYQDKRKARNGSRIDTIAEIIERWAPSVENDTRAYIDAVDRAHPRGAWDVLNVHRYEDIEPLVKAIIRQELGTQPYSQATIDRGLLLAGIEKPTRRAAA